MIIKIIYTLFLSLLIALFVGLGIDAFYPGPESPEYPIELEMRAPTQDNTETAEEKAQRMEFTQAQRDYDEAFKNYNRNVSVITLTAAIIILVLSLTLFKKIKMIADGILLGGVFTTLYSIIRGMMSESSQFRFIIVVVGLIIALALGYYKFIRPKESTS